MVHVMPDDIWYWRVQPVEVLAIAERHLINGQPIQAMLYPRYHPAESKHPPQRPNP